MARIHPWPAAVLAACIVTAACGKEGADETRPQAAAPEEATAIPINVSWQLPADLAPGAGLPEAAAFAWQEFIALNWAAVPQTGAPNTRDFPDTTKTFGSPTYAGPLVWHTFRAKIEIFPAPGKNPNGYVNDPTRSFGYDALPQYVYSNPIAPFDSASRVVPWINLDENDEIGQDAMYAGVATGQPFPGDLILFMAKANRSEYSYVAGNQFFNPTYANPAQHRSSQFVLANQASPPAGSRSYASLPNGTVEAKAAWRRLTPAEAGSGRFYQTRVRFYRANAAGDTTYQDATFGLVALHIIHKTPTRPYFVFATFEQADNLLTASGDTVETVEGVVRPQYRSLPPFEALVTSRNAQQPSADTGYTPSNVQQLSPATSNSTPGKRTYIRNSPGFSTTQGVISINRRTHSIPPAVIVANQAAHAAIIQYETPRGYASPWRYYKLVNVQYQPLTKQPGVNYGGADSATYYLSNSVVETNYNLQVFSGMFQPSFTYGGGTVNRTGTITDWCAQNGTYQPAGCPKQPAPFLNVRAGGHSFNMGGCMGCHGNAQVNGSDFSFIMGEINNATVQLADPVTAPNDTEKFFRIFRMVQGAAAAPPAPAPAPAAAPAAPPPAGTRRR